MATNSAKTKRPSPPEDMEGEALLEWGRVCDELETAGRLQSADRAMLVLWCTTWSVHHAVTKHVNQFGAILPAANKVIGRSPWYQVQRETHTALVKLADEMGLTAKTRQYDRSAQEEIQPLDAE